MYSDMFEIINVITPLFLIYLLMFFLVIGQRYLRLYSRNKILKFTQEEVKERKKEISALIIRAEIKPIGGIYPAQSSFDDKTEILYEVLSLYNELAVGVNEGLYDELYIKMVVGNDMMNFYKKYSSKAIYYVKDESIFMPLELLLKKWDSNNGPSYVEKHRRYK